MVELGVMGRVNGGLCNEPDKEKHSQSFVFVCPDTHSSVFPLRSSSLAVKLKHKHMHPCAHTRTPKPAHTKNPF